MSRFRRPELQDVRSWPVTGFEKIIVFYRHGDEGVEIMRVLHGARDVGGIFEA